MSTIGERRTPPTRTARERVRRAAAFWLRPYGLSMLINAWILLAICGASPSPRALLARALVFGACLIGWWTGCRALCDAFGVATSTWRRVVASAIFGVAQCATLLLAVASVRGLGSLPNDGMLIFTLHDASGALRVFADAVPRGALLPAAAIGALFVASWAAYLAPRARAAASGYRRFAPLLVCAAGFGAAGLPLPAELSTPIWIGRLAYYHYLHRVPGVDAADKFVADRLRLSPVATPPGTARPNVVLFRLEEIAADRFGLAHPETPTTPDLAALGADPSGTLVYFTHAHTNAGATDVSIPSIMTGLSPTRSGRDFGHLPLVWQYAHALGYDTSYIAPFDTGWGNLDHSLSLLSGAVSVDHLVDARQFGAPILYDSCVSDDLVSHAAVDAIDRHGAAPFFMVVDYCLTHFQGAGVPNVTPRLPCTGTDYDCAIAATDRQMDIVVSALRRKGLLDRTLIVGVSDHGTNLQRTARVLNFYQEVAHVPFFVFVPASMTAGMDRDDPGWRRAGSRTISNVDTTPTIVDLIGGRRDPEIAALIDALDGRNVFSPAAGDRDWIEMVNTNALRHWRPEGYALIYRGRYKMIYFDGTRQIFDLDRDPGERSDLLRRGGVDPAIVAAFKAHMFLSPRLSAIESDGPKSAAW